MQSHFTCSFVSSNLYLAERFELQICCRTCQNFISFYGWLIFCCVDASHCWSMCLVTAVRGLFSSHSCADRKAKALCPEREEGWSHQKRWELHFAYGSGHCHLSPDMRYLTWSSQQPETPLLSCTWRAERRRLLVRTTLLMKAWHFSSRERTAELCTEAESGSGAAGTFNMSGGFSRQSPNTKHDFQLLYLGLREGASGGNKVRVHCARRKLFFFSWDSTLRLSLIFYVMKFLSQLFLQPALGDQPLCQPLLWTPVW